MTKKRFMVDDAGTLIDMQTRDMFDIVEEVCPLLNELHEENQVLFLQMMLYKSELDVFANQNKKLERQIKEQFDLLIKARKQGFIDF